MFIEGNSMLNKKELEQTIDFLTVITETARCLLDEVASFEATISENKSEQKAQSEQRQLRKKRQYAKQKAKN